MIVSLQLLSNIAWVVTPSKQLGITLDDLLALGRQNPNDTDENFNMAYLAIRGSGRGEWREPPAWKGQPATL